MTTKITAPDERFTGPTYIGPTILDFREGVATTDVALKAGTRRYLEKRGYKVEDEDEGPFDPSKHNQDDVLAHLQGLTDADERQRIVAAEADGKGRQKIAAYAEELAVQGADGGSDPGDGADGQGNPDDQGGGDQ